MPNPQISMSTSANYITQSSLFDNIRLGRLTDRRIEKYRKLGYYSNGFKEERQYRQERKPKVKRVKAQKFMLSLLDDLLK